MRGLLLRLEPLIWGLFGGGMFVGALLLPAWCIVAGVLLPLREHWEVLQGLLPSAQFPILWEHLHFHLSQPLGRAVAWAAVALPLWAGAHQARHLVTDFGGLRWDGLVGGLCYAAAALGSLLAAAAVLAL